MPAVKVSLHLEAAERAQWPRVYSLGIGSGLGLVGDSGQIRQRKIAKGNLNSETRTNPGHDCNPGLRFC